MPETRDKRPRSDDKRSGTSTPDLSSLSIEERREIQIKMGNSSHVDVDELHSADGLFAVISQRRVNGMFTFAIFKSFQRPDSERAERTSFIPEDMGESYIKLTKLVLERIQKIRAEGTAPFKERLRA